MTKPPTPEAHIFSVEMRFHKLARRGGGVSRDKVIEQAQDQIEKIKPGFDQWLEDELQQLTKLITAVEMGQAKPNWVNSANLLSRQLCDSSGTLGFQLLSFIAGSLCDVLDTMETGAECNMELIACHVDALNLAARKSYRRLQPEQVPELTEGLRRVVQRSRVDNRRCTAS